MRLPFPRVKHESFRGLGVGKTTPSSETRGGERESIEGEKFKTKETQNPSQFVPSSKILWRPTSDKKRMGPISPRERSMKEPGAVVEYVGGVQGIIEQKRNLTIARGGPGH